MYHIHIHPNAAWRLRWRDALEKGEIDNPLEEFLCRADPTVYSIVCICLVMRRYKATPRKYVYYVQDAVPPMLADSPWMASGE